MTIHEPCRCDPPESGEENCNGGCTLRAELAAAEREGAEQTTKHEQLKRLYEQCSVQRKEWHTIGRRLASDALAALSGAGIATPAEGYVQAPALLKGDIQRLAQERDTAVADSAVQRWAVWSREAVTDHLSTCDTCDLSRKEAEDEARCDEYNRLSILAGEAFLAANRIGAGQDLLDTLQAAELRVAGLEAELDGLRGHYDAVRDLVNPVTQRLADERVRAALLTRDLEDARAEQASANARAAGWSIDLEAARSGA